MKIAQFVAQTSKFAFNAKRDLDLVKILNANSVKMKIALIVMKELIYAKFVKMGCIGILRF